MVKKGARGMDRLFIRENHEKAKEPRQINIGITGLGRSVGTTLAASSLALYLAEAGYSVTFTQCGDTEKTNGLLFVAAAIDKRFYGREFTDFYGEIAAGRTIRNRRNVEMGVNWRLMTPTDVDGKVTLDEAQKTRFMSGTGDDVCIFDIEPGSGYEEFLVDMDVIVAVVDPLPSRMTADTEAFRKLLAMEGSGNFKFIWLVSGVNSGVSKRQVRNFIRSNEISWVDRVPDEVIYRNEYRCRFQWEDEAVKTIFSDVFTKVSHYIAN